METLASLARLHLNSLFSYSAYGFGARNLKSTSSTSVELPLNRKTLFCDLYIPVSEPQHGFSITCLPAGMHVHISRQSLPPAVDPSLLRLDDPHCGVIQMDDNDVMLATPLDSCGTTRRYPTG